MLRVLGWAAALMLLVPSQSRSDALVQDTGVWSLGILRAPVRESWRIYFEYQARFVEQARQYERVLVRPALIYDISPEWAFVVGYAWTPTFQPVFNDENRYWQMITYRRSLDRWVFQTWNRIEERQIQGIESLTFRFRSRQFLTEKIHPQDWGWSFWNETFFHLSNASPEIRTGFDQNRAFVGAQYRLTNHAVIEGGYLNLFINRYTKDDRMQHTLLMALIADL